MIASLEEFAELYERRPFRTNEGGMGAPHMFLFWFVLRHLKPRAVIESGVWRGQGTWLMEQACPESDLHCIEIRPQNIRYRSRRARYYETDFSTLDWTRLPTEETLVFFDDHQNAYERCKTAKWLGFKHLVFEDNYAPGQGDCYSLKKAFAGAGHRQIISGNLPLTYTAKRLVESVVGLSRYRFPTITPNDLDAKYLRQHVAVYEELPPVFKAERTRFGETWQAQPTAEPLLDKVEHEYQRIFQDEAQLYTWMAYVRLH